MFKLFFSASDFEVSDGCYICSAHLRSPPVENFAAENFSNTNSEGCLLKKNVLVAFTPLQKGYIDKALYMFSMYKTFDLSVSRSLCIIFSET